jgi:uncharacterized protein YfaS (alpha-2-macroglobulin family)
MMKYSKLLFIFALFYLFPVCTGFTSTEEYWREVDKATYEGLPRTAIEYLDRILEVTQKQKRYDEWLRALTKKIVFEATIQGNKPEEKVKRLKEELEKSDEKTKALLHVILAEWYWHYYQRNRYRFIRRSPTEKMSDEDFTTWDLRKLFNEIDLLYQNALKERKLLLKIPIEDFLGFLERGNTSSELRPTLYDFIAHEALDFYSSAEQGGAYPEDAFEIDAHSKAFASLKEFLTYTPETGDTLSSKYKVIELFKLLMRYHYKRNNVSALLDLDIERLRYVKNYSFGEDKNEIYILRLNELVEKYSRNELSSLAAFYLAQAWGEKDSLLKAYKIAKEGYERHPNSIGGRYCNTYMTELTAKSIRIIGEKCIPPESSKILIQYKNFTKIFFRIYRDKWDAFMDKEYFNPNYISKEEIAKMLMNVPYKEWEMDLPETKDLKKKFIEVEIPKLETGYYRLFVSGNSSFADPEMIQYTWLWVSTFTVVTRTRSGLADGLVLDINTGEPIEKVEVVQIVRDKKLQRFGEKTYTNSKGLFQFKLGRKERLNAYLYFNKNGEELLDSRGVHVYKERPTDPFERVFFFTDRSIYRPGQTIYFKGIYVHVDQHKENYKVLPRKTVEVCFLDANRQEITTETFHTNDFGSFSGQFTVPTDRLTGRMIIRAKEPYGSISVSVEEYKRPKFTVEVEKPKEAYRLDQKIEIVGNAVSYTGAPVNDGLVRYKVQRAGRSPYWWSWYFPIWHSKTQLITHGETKTNEKGEFIIPFFAKPDLKISPEKDPRFTYTVYADVISPDGETRSAQQSVVLGYSALSMRLVVDKDIQNDKEFKIKVETSTLDGENIPAEGSLKAYVLKQPENPIRGKFWRQDSLYRNPEGGKVTMEHFTSNWRTWPKDSVILETRFDTKSENPSPVSLTLPTGLYQIECISKDKFGKEVKVFLPLMVLPDWNKNRFDIKLPSVMRIKDNVVEVGDDLHVLWGTGYKKGRCFVEIEWKGKIIQQYWTKEGDTQHTFCFPVSEKYRGGFIVYLTHVKNNRAYIQTIPISVPWSERDVSIDLETFRDRLQPGKLETIVLKIKHSKPKRIFEMVATMYDFSLDQFKKHLWSKFSFFKIYQRRAYSAFVNGSQYYSIYRDDWRDRLSYPEIRYIHFPIYVVRDYIFYRFPVSISKRPPLKQVITPSSTHGTITGRVVDAQTGEVLPGVNVVIEGKEVGSDTDVWGNFVLENAPLGTFSITAKMIGYESKTVMNVKSIKGKVTTVNIELDQRVVKLEGVAVVGKREVEPDVTGTSMEIITGGFSGEYGEVEPTNGGVEKIPEIDYEGIQIRRVLKETAFFFPHLVTEKDGTIKISFRCPETLTKWKFIGFVHGKKLESDVITHYAISQKKLMVQPNPPRFLRETDTLHFTAKVINVSEESQLGKVQLDFSDLITEKPMNSALGLRDYVKTFNIKAQSSETFSWKVIVPKGTNPLSYTVVAKSKDHSDGEAGSIPVLSVRKFLTESLPLHIRGPKSCEFTFESVSKIETSKTLDPFRFKVQMSSNPSWYAIQALPYLIEPVYKCSEQIFNQYYANNLAQHIANSDPEIRKIFDQWKDLNVLESNLEKNEDVKSVLLQGTPWVLESQNEAQAKKNIGLLLEEKTIKKNLNDALKELKNMQRSNGSWPWFPGGRPNYYITMYIITGFGRLKHLGVDDDVSFIYLSLNYTDSIINEIYKKIGNKSENNLTHQIAFYLYGRSFFLEEMPIPSRYGEAVEYFLDQGEENWLSVNSRLSQGYLALAFNRFGRKPVARKIMASIKERSVQDEEMGMFWRETELSWWWYRAPIETQALMIEAFLEVMNDTVSAEECKVWLLKQKQTQNWRTTKATADAIYGLILRGPNFLGSEKLVQVRLGEMDITPQKGEAGTGFYEKIFSKGEIKPDFTNITVTKEDEGIAWGGCYFQYFEEMSKIVSHETNLKLEKKLFVNRETKKGKIIEPIAGKLDVGDLVTVRIVLRVDRDMEFVHLKDQRGSGLEPVDVLSHYRYQDGLRYYQSTMDVATHFFIDYLPKGTYVFEYDLRVQHRGKYQSGIAEIQCMYAPEFSSHSQSFLVNVE